jgi:hypothetical protein
MPERPRMQVRAGGGLLLHDAYTGHDARATPLVSDR